MEFVAFFLPRIILLLTMLLILSEVSLGERAPILRTLTFNTWLAGQKVEFGLLKILQHIKGLHADIVFLQEMDADSFEWLMTKLGPVWTGVIHKDHKESKPAILTKHKIISGTEFRTNWTFGLSIRHASGVDINVVNAHLNYRDYGPYIVQQQHMATVEQILAGDFKDQGRLQNVMELEAHPAFKKFLAQALSGTPLILGGDFNEPSHVDWKEDTKHLHRDMMVEWPVTKLLAEKLGFIDSFRQLYSNPSEEPGNTWSSIWADAYEPQDRIDFIFYKSDNVLKPVRSFLFSGTMPLKKLQSAEHWVDNEELEGRDWPSDHYALVTDFRMKISTRK